MELKERMDRTHICESNIIDKRERVYQGSRASLNFHNVDHEP